MVNKSITGGVTPRIEGKDTYYDVVVKVNGVIVAEEFDFLDENEARAFYWKHVDVVNIKERIKINGERVYDAQFYQGAGKRKLTKSFSRRKDAINWRKQQREAKESGNGELSAMPLTAYSAEWFETDVLGDKSQNTIDTYRRMLDKHILPVIGHLILDNIKPMHVKKVMSIMNRKGMAPKSINLAKAIVGRILKHAIINEVIEKNIMILVEKTKDPDKDILWWTIEDIKLFLRHTKGSTHYPLYYSGLRTGMRKGELLALRWGMIRFDLNQIFVSTTRTAKGEGATKSGKTRKVPIAKDLRELLLEIKEKRNPQPTDYVFLNNKDNPVGYQTINTLFNNAQRAAGVSKQIKFHGLRHTFASQFLLKGGDLNRLQKLLGHADMKMTQHYGHITDEHVEESIEFIENLEIAV